MTTLFKQLLTEYNFSLLRDYRSLLQTLHDLAGQTKTDMKLEGDHDFLRLYQPSLETTLRHATGQINNWPDVFDWYNGPFYQLMDLSDDILLFYKQLEGALEAMSREQRHDYFSTLDFNRPPFHLNGRFKKLTVAPPQVFATDLKLHLYNRHYQTNNGAFEMGNLVDRIHMILPHFVNFMEGAVDRYAENQQLDRLNGDTLIVTARTTITRLITQSIGITVAAQQLAEGYSRLAGYLLDAYQPLVDVVSTTSIGDFGEKMDTLMPNINEAKAMWTAE